MRETKKHTAAGAAAAFLLLVFQAAPGGEAINLADRLNAGKLRPVNRDVKALQERDGIHVSARPGAGVVWLEGVDFNRGTLEVDVRGRDLFQQSFVGIAFHGKDDETYEAVYLRPFNFRAEDPVRRQHAVQYMALPEYDWPRLRKEFPEEFENPVDGSVTPTDWIRLRVIVEPASVRIYIGQASQPALEARKLGRLEGGRVGLWTGNNSEGEFANLVVKPAS